LDCSPDMRFSIVSIRGRFDGLDIVI
jgi:hypothetical protein